MGSRTYRQKMEQHLRDLAEVVPAALHRRVSEDYYAVYQEIRNEVCDELKRMSNEERAREREYGAEEERARIREVLGL